MLSERAKNGIRLPAYPLPATPPLILASAYFKIFLFLYVPQYNVLQNSSQNTDERHIYANRLVGMMFARRIPDY